MARDQARTDASFAGTPTGANVVAALAAARRGLRVVTLAADTGLKYLSTECRRAAIPDG